MPTDSFEIAFSDDSDYNGGIGGTRLKIGPFSSINANLILNAVREALIDAGWVDTGSTKAKLIILFPYGLPSVIPAFPEPGVKPASTGPHVVTVQGVRFRLYDPSRELPGDLSYNWVQIKSSSNATLAELIAAIDSFTPWAHSGTAAYYSGYELTFLSDADGTEYNSVAQGGVGTAAGRPFWSHLNFHGAGGWRLRSTTAEGHWLEVWMYANTNSNDISLSFTVSHEGSPVVFTLPPHSSLKYSVIANQFHFAIFRTVGTGDNERFIYAAQPYLQKDCEQAAIVLSSGNRASLYWITGTTAFSRGTPLLRAGYPDGYSKNGPKMYVLRSADPILTSQGYSLAASAYIGIPDSITSDARVVGKLYDAVLLSRSVNTNGTSVLDNTMLYRGLEWYCIARNSATGSNPTSLWLAYKTQAEE